MDSLCCPTTTHHFSLGARKRVGEAYRCSFATFDGWHAGLTDVGDEAGLGSLGALLGGLAPLIDGLGASAGAFDTLIGVLGVSTGCTFTLNLGCTDVGFTRLAGADTTLLSTVSCRAFLSAAAFSARYCSWNNVLRWSRKLVVSTSLPHPHMTVLRLRSLSCTRPLQRSHCLYCVPWSLKQVSFTIHLQPRQ